MPTWEQVRKWAGRNAVDAFFSRTAGAARWVPWSRPGLHGVELVRDLAYRDSGSRDHLLDVYRPKEANGPRPVVLYVHGGGFRILSKETHWVFGLMFARRGFVTFNVNYRLAPAHPFPAAVEDACAAYRWVVENAERFGGDPGRLVLAGESAGANLVTVLTLAACYPREEPHALAVWETGVVPAAVLPACGLFQVTDIERYATKRLNRLVLDRLEEVSQFYLPDPAAHPRGELDLADPVVALERGEPPARPLPPFFMSVGSADPIADETDRLAHALQALGATAEARSYPGGMHAFQAFLWRTKARRAWRDTFAFLDRHVGPPSAPPATPAEPS